VALARRDSPESGSRILRAAGSPGAIVRFPYAEASPGVESTDQQDVLDESLGSAAPSGRARRGVLSCE